MLIHQHVLMRDRINTELNYIFDYPLTVIVASMGYGKSTAIRDYLKSIKVSTAYLSVENYELLPQHIWDSLTRQLAKSIPELGTQLRELGFPVDTPQMNKVLNILEEYTYSTKTIIVIDDYHFCHSAEFNQVFYRIVKNRIKGLHIILLSRITPEIKIEELTLKGYCYQIKSDLFEFKWEEIKSFSALYGYCISEETARQVHNMTEGWISAIYLIMKRYAEIGRIESGSSLDRLIETSVMWRYSDKDVRILKSLCVLDHFSVEQAVYMTDNPETERIIQKISYKNSFIRFDEQARLYRIHNIFNNFLKKLLFEDNSGLVIKELYRRAGEWLINNDDILSGLNYLLMAKEYNRILIEFEKQCITGFIDKNQRYIQDLFSQIPLDIRFQYPIGYIAYIGFYVTNVDCAAGAKLLIEAEQYYHDKKDLSPEVKRRISGEIELIRAYTQFNDVTLMHQTFKRAHKLLNGRSEIANKNKIITFGSPHVLYLYYREKGKLIWTMEQLEALFPYYSEMAGGCGMGFEHLLRAEYYMEIGNLEEAELSANKAILKAKRINQVSIIICADFIRARILIAKGNIEEADEIMDNLKVEVELCNSPILGSAYDLCAGYIEGISCEKTYHVNWLNFGNIKDSEVLYQGIGFNYIVYGKYLLQEKEYLKLELLCEEMVQTFQTYENQLGYLHMYLLSAAAKFQMLGFEEAKKPMLSALDIAKMDSILQPVVEYGRYIIDILRALQATTIKDNYIDHLVKLTSGYIRRLEKKKALVPSKPLLTSREKEILRLIVEGYTNRLIASELFLAEVTVRKNITTIYRKLRSNGRASAVKRALELEIF